MSHLTAWWDYGSAPALSEAILHKIARRGELVKNQLSAPDGDRVFFVPRLNLAIRFPTLPRAR